MLDNGDKDGVWIRRHMLNMLPNEADEGLANRLFDSLATLNDEYQESLEQAEDQTETQTQDQTQVEGQTAARMQDQTQAENQAAATTAGSPTKIKRKMAVTREDGSKQDMDKATYLRLQKDAGRGNKISADRLTRVTQAVQQQILELSEEEAATLGEDAILKQGAHACIAVKYDNGTFGRWFGRVEQMFKKTGKRGRLTQFETGIHLADAKKDDVRIVCTWFLEEDDHTFTYNANEACIDPAKYSAQNVLSLVVMNFKKRSAQGKDGTSFYTSSCVHVCMHKRSCVVYQLLF